MSIIFGIVGGNWWTWRPGERPICTPTDGAYPFRLAGWNLGGATSVGFCLGTQTGDMCVAINNAGAWPNA